MSYPWNNQKRLAALQAEGAEDILTFSTDGDSVKVYIEGGDIRRVVCTVMDHTTTIENAQAHHIVVGEENFQRDVYHYLKPGGPSRFLRLGITKHRGYGTWSSLPHPFELNGEPGFEEVFFYLLSGGPQRAVQIGKGVWYDGTVADDAWFVYNHSWSTIPMGYHPVVGEPHVHVSYIWAYLAKKGEWEKI